MAYDHELGDRIREAVQGEDGLTEKRMFGGLAFLVNGHLAVAAGGQGGLMVRVEPSETEALVAQPHVRRMQMRGRELDGWLHVDAEALDEDGELSRWASQGVGYARSLPPR